MNFTWIEAGVLAASACPSKAEDLTMLYDAGIRAIITLTEDSLPKKLQLSQNAIEQSGLILHHAPIQDYHAPTETLVRDVTAFIDRMRHAQKPVLVHCMAGQERTGTILHAYYMLHGLSIEAANAKIAAVRPQSAYEKLVAVQQEFLTTFAASLK